MKPATSFRGPAVATSDSSCDTQEPAWSDVSAHRTEHATLPPTESLQTAGRPSRQPVSALAVPRANRTLATQERLRRLRKELSRIHPAPGDPYEAHSEILAAMTRAGLTEWRLPPLSDPVAGNRTRTGWRLTLLAHTIDFDHDGGFRIDDLHTRGAPYFEMKSRGESAPLAWPAPTPSDKIDQSNERREGRDEEDKEDDRNQREDADHEADPDEHVPAGEPDGRRSSSENRGDPAPRPLPTLSAARRARLAAHSLARRR